MRRFGTLLVTWLAFACSDDDGSPSTAPAPESPQRAPSTVPAPPAIEVAGCHHRPSPDVCVLRAGADGHDTLGLWVDLETSATLQVQADDVVLTPQPRPADGGQHLPLRIGAGTTRLSVTGLDPTWPEAFTLALQWESSPDVVVRAEALAAEDPNEAITALEDALPSLAPLARLAALQLLRRALYRVGRRDESHRRADEAATLARSLGRDRDLADTASAMAWTLITSDAFTSARRWLDEIEALEDTVPEARVWTPYYEGLWLAATGDLTNASRRMADAERHAQRLGMADEQRSAFGQRAVYLGELGRADEALQLVHDGMERIEAPGISCQARAMAWGSLGWAQLRLVQQGLHPEVPWEAFERALQAHEHECPNPIEANNQRVNLALAALVDGDIEQAHAWYQELRAREVGKWLEPWVDEIGARVAWASGRWDLAPSILLRPEPTRSMGLDWSIAVRRAETLDALGMHAAAIEAFADAERMLDEAAAAVGPEAGAEMFLASRSDSARGLVRALVQRGASSEALCRARVARRRALHTLDRAARIASLSPDDRARWDRVAAEYLETRATLQQQAQQDWTLSATQQQHQRQRRQERLRAITADFDETRRTLLAESDQTGCDALPRWPEDERLLLVTRDDEGLLVFVATADGTVDVVEASTTPSPRAGLQEALATQVARLEGAARIRVMTDGWDHDLRWPTLTAGARPLLDVAPLVHALDLSDRGPVPAGPRRALVIADPSEDLPAAREEAHAVVRQLSDAGWTVELREGATATRDATLEPMRAATLLHYAGHGVHRGTGGWEAALVLHGGELGILDILAAPRVPAAVVLAGCDTGTHSEGAWAGGVNLGRAFVLSGAAEVLVADDPLDDRRARQVGEALARALAAESQADTVDLARALWTVQRTLRDDERAASPETGEAAWWSLRVLVP